MYFFEYKGYVIYPSPRKVADANSWKVQLTIRREKDIKKFDLDEFYSTQSEAAFHSIAYGKKLIDDGI